MASERPPLSSRVARALTVWEKRDYKFKSYRHATAGSVLFAGCAFPSFFPRTYRALREELSLQAGIGSVLDCCSEPLLGLAGEGAADTQLDRVRDGLRAAGVRELVAVCPNCAARFSGKLGIPVVSVYAKLRELGIGRAVEEPGIVFVPCPDKESLAWYSEVEPFFGGRVLRSSARGCCGAAFQVERPQASLRAAERVLASAQDCEACAQGDGPVCSGAESAAGQAGSPFAASPALYVYCASCAGRLERARLELGRASAGFGESGVRVVHVLSAILGVSERPAVRSSVMNRAKAALS